MKIKDVFEEISVGYNISNTTVKDKYSKIYKTLHKDSIQLKINRKNIHWRNKEKIFYSTKRYINICKKTI